MFQECRHFVEQWKLLCFRLVLENLAGCLPAGLSRARTLESIDQTVLLADGPDGTSEAGGLARLAVRQPAGSPD